MAFHDDRPPSKNPCGVERGGLVCIGERGHRGMHRFRKPPPPEPSEPLVVSDERKQRLMRGGTR